MPVETGVLEQLARFSTPSVANGIETFDLRGRHEGYTDGSIVCRFPDLGVAVGYAATATIRAREPGEDHSRTLWAHVLAQPAPRIVVVQDLDEPPGVGSLWGEVNSTIFKALGALGVVTNGCVRDLEEMRTNGFHAFSASVCVSHASVHVASVGEPVSVGGLEVSPGDLLHMDRHGVLHVPDAIAPALPAAIEEVEARERGVIEMFRAPDFDARRFVGDVGH